MLSEEKMSMGKNLDFSFPDILECFFQPQRLCLINCRSVPFLCGILLFSRAVSVVLYLFILSALLVQDGTFCRELNCFTECFIFIYLHICLYIPFNSCTVNNVYCKQKNLIRETPNYYSFFAQLFHQQGSVRTV